MNDRNNELAILIDFSYLVEVRCRLRFQVIGSQKILTVSHRDPLAPTFDQINSLIRTIERACLDGARVLVLLGIHEIKKGSPLISHINSLLNFYPGRVSLEQLHPKAWTQVERKIRGFLGDEAIVAAVSEFGISHVLNESPILCVGESGHAKGFRTTIIHSGLLRQGLKYEELACRYSDKELIIRDTLSRVATHSRLLYASSGLGRLPLPVSEAWAGRLHEGQYALDAICSFYHQIQSEQFRQELREARLVQIALSGNGDKSTVGYSIAHRCQPARMLAGDFHKVIRLSDDRISLLIVDVTGKGPSAAVLATHIQGLITGYVEQGWCPKDLCEKVSDDLCHLENTGIQQNSATLVYGQYFPAKRLLIYANAGHPAPMLFRHNGEIVTLSVGGKPVGMLPCMKYEEASVELSPDDIIVLFTDGLTDAINSEGVEFGRERIESVITNCCQQSAEHLASELDRAIQDFSFDGFDDDVTILVFKAH